MPLRAVVIVSLEKVRRDRANSMNSAITISPGMPEPPTWAPSTGEIPLVAITDIAWHSATKG